MSRVATDDGPVGDGGAGTHIMQEMRLDVSRTEHGARATAPVWPEMWVPGTSDLRISILAAWSDIVSGYLAIDVMEPRVPVTLELDVHLYRPAFDLGRVQISARVLKTGRAVTVVGATFHDGNGAPLGVGSASFMASPNESFELPPMTDRWQAVNDMNGRLKVPFAERARCTRQSPGVAVLPRSEDGLNATDSINGGLIALAIEEAALTAAVGNGQPLATTGHSLSSLAVRYLRPARVGPAVATAEARAGLGQVEVHDTGRDNRLVAVGTTRSFL